MSMHTNTTSTNTTKTIEITVSPAGESPVQTRGFVGPACRDASKFLEQALGQRTGEQLTAEFHQSQTVANEQQQPSS